MDKKNAISIIMSTRQDKPNRKRKKKKKVTIENKKKKISPTIEDASKLNTHTFHVRKANRGITKEASPPYACCY